MMQFTPPDLSPESHAFLEEKQRDVDALATRRDRYERATLLFSAKANRAFTEIRRNLASAAPSDQSCYYCERDRHRDIDHIWPKRHYPERAFRWDNYVYACAICNQDQKRDTFAVFDPDENVISFSRTLAFDVPIPIGDPVLIDIRTEDPFDFLKLDLTTGIFGAIGDGKSLKRAIFTRDLFNLNADALCRIRRNAFQSLMVYLGQLQDAVANGDGARTTRIVSEIYELSHPTVLAEAKRQRENFQGLDELIANLPE